MRFLLDTHTAIWAVSDSARLPIHVRELILDEANTLFVSAASVWEIAVKHLLGKVSAPPFSGWEAVRLFRAAGYTLVDVTPEVAAGIEDHPIQHADPFDRLILTLSLDAAMPLITHDRQLAAYSDTVITF